MNNRIFLSVLFAFACMSMMAQPRIISITYEGNEAVLTRNNPPAGVVYYWQGTSCGELMVNSDPTYIATTSSTFYIRAYLSSSASWASSCASTVVIFPDVIAPVLYDVTEGDMEPGAEISATSNEDGMIYLVPAGTAADMGAINTAKVAEAAVTAGVPAVLSTTGLSLGDYIVYAVDEAGNVSFASDVISLLDMTAPVLSDVTGGPVEIGDDISATSNEDGMIYLVPDGTAADLGAINTAKVAETAVTAGVPVMLPTTGISEGDYIVYAVDASENVSAPSDAITVNEQATIIIQDVSADDITLYPVIVRGMLYIKSPVPVASVAVYTLQGSQVMSIRTTADHLDVSSLAEGIYIVKIGLANNHVFTGRIVKE